MLESKDGRQRFNTVKTDGQGRYISEGLQPGVYRVTLAVNGAVKASITNTKTKAGQTTQLNFDLKPVPVAQASAGQKKGKHMVLGASEYGKPYRRSMGRRSLWQRQARHVERTES